MKGERVINYRPTLLLAAGAMLGIFICSLFSNLIFIISLSVLIFGISVYLIIKKKRAAVFTVAFLLCFISYFIVFSVNTVEKSYVNEYFSARVTEQFEGYAVLENVKTEDDTLTGKVYIETENPLEVGTKIYFIGSLEKTVVDISDSYTIYLYKHNYTYKGSIYLIDKVEKSYLMPDEWVRYRVKTALTRGQGEDIASISMGLLFGDISGIDDNTYDAVKASGFAHIFAVSGLHIGFLVALIEFFLRRTKRKISFFVMIALIVFYAYLSGFSPSVSRAVLMTFFLLFGNLIGRPKDALSSLALSAFIILLFKPLFLFEVGFLMSVTSVFGIILLYKPLNKAFLRIFRGKIGKYISGALALSFSANIALVPILANYFGTLAIYFFISNLLALPLVTVAFIYSVALIPFISFFPSLAPLSIPSGWILILVKNIAYFVSSLPFSTIALTMSVGLGLIYTFSYTLLSRYINLNKKTKYLTVSSMWGVCFLIFLILNV